MAPRSWLPSEGSWSYHALLGVAGMLVLGPLAALAAAYMNFSLGFFVGGQVLAGLLGSLVTAGYGPSGRHGANYIQSAAASVAGMGGMAVLVQGMAWMGIAQPPAWQLVLYLACIGLFGVGVGMLCTPLLVDRLQLTYPSGLAVANILRALTDPVLLRRSLAMLGSGLAAGVVAGFAAAKVAVIGALQFSGSTFGAGLVIGPRIALAAVTGGLLCWALQPLFLAIGWLQPGDPFRKITFLLALGAILGAALIDLALVLRSVLVDGRPAPPASDAWRRVDIGRLLLWVVAWGAAIVLVGSGLLGQPLRFQLLAIGLVFLFALVNGISAGVSDLNPISSAFVVSVVLMALAGLTDAATGLMAGAILLVSTSVACDMQQDRSTGARLGTPRVAQFRYQVAGIVVGAVLAVALAQVFMAAYPVLAQDQTVMKDGQQPLEWGAAMTYKIVGVLRGLTDDQPQQHTAIVVGIVIGFAVQAARLLLRASRWWQRRQESVQGRRFDFAVDAFLLPSPYALSFGGFVALPTTLWLGAGGVAAALLNARTPHRRDVPTDMGAASLLGGGLIAGDALAALGLGIAGLLALKS